MINYILLIPIIASFFITLFLVPSWIKKAKEIGLVWKDMNKYGSKDVPGSGGIAAVFGFLIGIFMFIAYRTFILGSEEFLIEILAITSVVLFLAGVGLVDDLLGWRKGGLRKRHRLVMAILAAIPLIVINAGRSDISLPFLGSIELGIIYPLIVIPIGIVGATYSFNFLAGFNGLEAGQGAILLSGLAFVAFFTGNSWLSVVALCMVASLLAFLIFNFYPAKIFPGDSLTYAIGSLVAIMAILGNFEKIALFFFIPYIIETFLTTRGKLIKQSFGSPKKDGSIGLMYDKIYSLTHAAIWALKKLRVKVTEKGVVYLIWIFQAIIILIGLIIFSGGIFG